MTLQDLQQDLNTSLKSGKSVRVATVRLLISAARNAAIAKYGNAWETSLTDADLTDTIKRQIKTHKESIEAFEKAGRADLAQKEKDELDVLTDFAPKEVSDEVLKKILAPIAASGEPNFGLLMKQAMTAIKNTPELAGGVDGGRVSSMLRQLQSK